MDNIDMGPPWFWRLLAVLAAVGIFSILVWIIEGIIWLFNHVKIVP